MDECFLVWLSVKKNMVCTSFSSDLLQLISDVLVKSNDSSDKNNLERLCRLVKDRQNPVRIKYYKDSSVELPISSTF